MTKSQIQSRYPASYRRLSTVRRSCAFVPRAGLMSAARSNVGGMADYLYDSRGEPIAFRRGRNVHNMRGDWIGWFPWNDADVVTPGGAYLGTVVGDELLKKVGRANRGHPGNPGNPGNPGAPGHPGNRGSRGLRAGYVDVDRSHLRR